MERLNKGCRPFPLDKDRQNRCREVLESYGMTQEELGLHLGVSKVYISNVFSGRRLSPSAETRIAGFFNLPREAMFPKRTVEQIYQMRLQEQEEKTRKENAKKLRMQLREKMLASAGVA